MKNSIPLQAGGVLYIYGEGFSDNNFNTFDPILGNKIWLYNDYETLPCQHPVERNWLLQNPQVFLHHDPYTVCPVSSYPNLYSNSLYKLR